MKSTVSNWLLDRPYFLLLPLAILVLPFIGACVRSDTPDEVVQLYLSAAIQGRVSEALEQWEFSDVASAALVTPNPEQQRIRMLQRRLLATTLTDALSKPRDLVVWEQVSASYYSIKSGEAEVIEDRENAYLATVQIKIAIQRVGQDTLEEVLAFNLWRSPSKGWIITGLNKSLITLQPLLDELHISP